MKLHGVVIARTGNSYEVECENKTILRCHARSKSICAVCGDHVEVESDTQTSVITSINKRKNTIQRIDPFHRTKTMAANVDHMIVVVATQPSYDTFGIDHYLLFAHHICAQVCIVLNKAESLPQDDPYRLHLEQMYQPLGYPIIISSTKTHLGLNQLEKLLAGKTSILVGQSGVGKSSIVNALLPDQPAMVGELSEGIDQGTHTTSQARCYNLPHGGRLIDSPGIRQFTPLISDIDIVQNGFPEIQSFAHYCKFNNCQHLNEPECAVQQAVMDGKINARRFESYQGVIRKLAASH